MAGQGRPYRESPGLPLSAEAISTASEKIEQAQIAQDLKLLANFGANIAVRWMKTGKARFECVGVGE